MPQTGTGGRDAFWERWYGECNWAVFAAHCQFEMSTDPKESCESAKVLYTGRRRTCIIPLELRSASVLVFSHLRISLYRTDGHDP